VDHRLPGRGLSRSTLQDLAHDDFVDGRTVHTSATQRFAYDN
jgi:hypothetical protein